MKHKTEFLSNRVQYLDVEKLRPNPQQPRSRFDEDAIEDLAYSISTHGILQPLTVRRREGGFELVAGERRLRAAKRAGLKQVPCLLMRVDEEEAGLLALIENLHRRDLDCFEEARAIAGLVERYGLSQEEAAQKLGKSQSAVANKLRLLRLPEEVRCRILEGGLTERHARVLLRLTDPEEQRSALEMMVRQKMNVAQSEALVEKILQSRQMTPPSRRSTYIIKDVRLFLNSIDHAMTVMRQAGVDAQISRQDTEESVLLTIRIPKNRAEK